MTKMQMMVAVGDMIHAPWNPRSGIDPMKEAELIGSMISLGYKQKEIAAHFGVSEAMICRRAKLMGLLPEIREIAQRSGNFATQCLEQIALYPVEIQRKCIADVTRNSKRKNDTVRWGDLQYSFSRETMNLNQAKFDTTCCLKCPKRTGSQPDLWGDICGDDDLGRCLDRKCYDCMMRKRNEAKVRDIVGSKVDIVCADDCEDRVYVMNIPVWCADLFGDRPTKKRPVAWWSWESWSDRVSVKFGPTLDEWKKFNDDRRAAYEAEKADIEKKSKESREKYEAEEAERNRIREERSALGRAVDEVGEHIDDLISKAVEDGEFLKAVKKFICGKSFKGKAADIVAEAVSSWSGCCDCELSFNVSILETFPNLAKAINVDSGMIKGFRDAEKDLAEFNAENPL